MGSMLTVLLLRECHGVCLYKPAWGRSATHHMTSFCFFDFPLIVCVGGGGKRDRKSEREGERESVYMTS